MDSYTEFATGMHRYRADQFTASVERARVRAGLPRSARSFRFGFGRLNTRRPISQAHQPV